MDSKGKGMLNWLNTSNKVPANYSSENIPAKKFAIMREKWENKVNISYLKSE
jgi:hypothetical protein